MKNSNAYELFFDGGIRRHPDGGYCCYYGWVIKQDGEVKLTGNGYERNAANLGSSGVELEAAARGLRDAAKLGATHLSVFGDSLTVIDCINGQNTHSELMTRGCDHLRGLAAGFEQVTFNWVPREQNALADHLGRLAFRADHETKQRHSLVKQVNDLYQFFFKNTLTKDVRAQWHLSLTGKASLTDMTTQEISRVMSATYDFVQESMVGAH